MKHVKKAALLLVPPAFLVAFLLLTDPYNLPLAFILVPFLILGITTYYVMRTSLQLTPLSLRKRTFIASTFTGTLLLLVLLQSIRQLSVKDLLILVALLVGLTFYVRRLDL
jgi:hypothetical protein